MKKVLLLGAGKSATVLIDYLLGIAKEENIFLTVADTNMELVVHKTRNHPHSQALQLDIYNSDARKKVINNSVLVISMLPPSLHILVAEDCLLFSKTLLTASYADDFVKKMDSELKSKKILFLYEMGLDPGIDHMSAKKLLDDIRTEGGIVKAFHSHCGGLISPESDNNPWHYKISWNPKNVVLAGKAGAAYYSNTKIIHKNYAQVFSDTAVIGTPVTEWGYYPNRDSLSYRSLYELYDTDTFIRTTLRHKDFMIGWQQVIALNLTDENEIHPAAGKNLQELFQLHLKYNGINNYKEYLLQQFSEQQVILFEEQLSFLGFFSDTAVWDNRYISAADMLQFAMEKYLSLQPHDKDMIVMLHEINYTINKQDKILHSYLEVTGDDSSHTAMAKTVGLPLGIAAKLILNGKIALTGLHIPLLPEIYNPVLAELEAHEIYFKEY